MLKYVIGILILVLWVNIFAEHQFGDIIIGGRAAYSTQNTAEEFTDTGSERDIERDRESFLVNPHLGYFVSQSVVLGLGLKYEYTFIKYENLSNASLLSTNERYRSIFSFVPYLSKYFKINDKISFSTMLEIEVGFGEYEYKLLDDKTEAEVLRLGGTLSPAISYSLSKNWLMTISMGSIDYNWTRDTLVGEEDYQNINSRLGINFNPGRIQLGLQYVYRRQNE